MGIGDPLGKEIPELTLLSRLIQMDKVQLRKALPTEAYLLATGSLAILLSVLALALVWIYRKKLNGWVIALITAIILIQFGCMLAVGTLQ